MDHREDESMDADLRALLSFDAAEARAVADHAKVPPDSTRRSAVIAVSVLVGVVLLAATSWFMRGTARESVTIRGNGAVVEIERRSGGRTTVEPWRESALSGVMVVIHR